MIKREDFTYATKQKGKIFNGTNKIRNNSNYVVFYKGQYNGELATKKDAERYIDNLVKYQKLTYTAEYK